MSALSTFDDRSPSSHRTPPSRGRASLHVHGAALFRRRVAFAWRAALALLCLAAAAPLQGCSSDEHPTKLAGGTFPENSGATLAVGDATELEFDEDLRRFIGEQVGMLEDKTSTADVNESLTLPDGRFSEIQLDKFADAVFLRLVGGSIQTFSASGSLTVELGDAELYATLPLTRGKKHFGLQVNFASHIASILALGLNVTTGQRMPSAAREANESVSAYFSVNMGDGEVLDVDVLRTTGRRLWGTGAHQGTVLTPNVILGAVTAGITLRANALATSGVTLSGHDYVNLVAFDAADGIADGVGHPLAGDPANIVFLRDILPGYPNEPLSADLAQDIEDFFASAADNSAISLSAVDPLLDRLRSQRGIIIADVPLILAVSGAASDTAPPAPAAGTPGSRRVTIDGDDFLDGAEVFFGAVATPQAVVLGIDRIVVDIPNNVGIDDGDQLFVTVRNPNGRRHSKFVTVTLP